MLFQIGVALLIIWVLNWCWIFWQLISTVKNWKELKSSDDLLKEFLANTSEEQLRNLDQIANMNPFFWQGGLAFIIVALIF